MDCTDIQRDYHNNVRLIFMSRDDDQNFRQQKSQLLWEKNLTQKFPRTLLNARAMAVGVLRLHMSAWDMRGCDNVSEKRKKMVMRSGWRDGLYLSLPFL